MVRTRRSNVYRGASPRCFLCVCLNSLSRVTLSGTMRWSALRSFSVIAFDALVDVSRIIALPKRAIVFYTVV